ncbi:hypothetical protein FB451DRAFT_1182121 [Mycena latifolia]|nr:hypothetical protein FB451DRAFT_1182121 [Mycena latifolia]
MSLPAVAIIGISAELPSGTSVDFNLDHDAFFKFLLNKGEAYEEVPANRFNIDGWQGPNLGQVLPRKGCFLKNVSEFDHSEFGITAKDAYAMALSTRKLIEHSFLALLDSGIDSRGQDVGVYMSGTAFDILGMSGQDVFEARGLLSGIPCMITNKVSYHLDLTGPSVPIDTACSSSLSALHLATQAIRAGECKAALVGGSQLNHRFLDFVQYSQSSVLAPDGKCKPFDAAADGQANSSFSRGEGVVVVVLKLLADAVRDGDHIYASILGTAINSTGSAAPAYAPVATAQRNAMEKAFSQTDCLPSDIDFIEAHATGTAAGDPTETNWVGSAFRRSDELLLGSVKGNIGHLEITAFLASLSKVCSIFETGLIPANVNFSTPNPAIRWKEYNLRVPIETTKLGRRSGRSLIAMSSSGIGGSNGHVVLEAPPQHEYSSATPQARPVLLVPGGLSPQTATAVAASLATSDPDDLSTLSTIHGRRSRQLTWRTFATWVPGQEVIEFPPPVLSPKLKAPIVFVFSGQGPQHLNMGRQLFKNFTIFRASVLRMDAVYRSCTGKSLINDFGLFDDVPPNQTLPAIWPIAITLPALIVLQMALYDLFIDHGVSPDIVLAHSAGETAMLYASGAVPQEMAVEIALARGLAMSSVEALGGAMAAVACSAERAADIIQQVVGPQDTDVLEIGCYNGAEAMALTGSEIAIDRAVECAQNQGIFARKIQTHVAAHSSFMENCREDYQARMSEIYARYAGEHVASRTTYSTQTGYRWVEPFTADYMWSNARGPVYFAKTVSTVFRDYPNAMFVEISPHPVLASYIASVGVKPDLVVAPLTRSKNPKPFAEVVDFLRALGKIMSLGYNGLDFRALNGPTSLKSTKKIPPYPFNRKHVPYQPSSAHAVLSRSRRGPLNYEGMGMNILTHPDMAQHVIQGEPILPATGYLEMVFELGARRMWNVEFIAMLPLLKDKVLRVETSSDLHHWEVRSWPSEQPNASRRLHACGFMTCEDQPADTAVLSIPEIQERCLPMPVKGFYDSIAYFAEYGPAFRHISEIWTGNNEGMVKIEIDAAATNALTDSPYIVNPAVLDSCLHALVHPKFTGDVNQNTYFLPSGIQEVILHADGKLPNTLFSYSTFREWHPGKYANPVTDCHYLVFDIVVADATGSKICSLLGTRVAKHGVSHDHGSLRHYDTEYQPMSSSYYVSPIQLPPSPDYVLLDDLVKLAPECSTKLQPAKPSSVQILDALPYPVEACFTQVCHALDHLVKQGKSVVSILEIGNGSLSRMLATLSQGYPSTTCVTSSSLAPPPEICFGLPSTAVDLGQPLDSQGLSAWRYDIIVGAHALGFVQDLTTSLKNLHDLLVPGGFLFISEVSGGPSIPSSFLPKGGMERRRYDKATWRQALRENGFNHFTIHIDDDERQLFLSLGVQKDILNIRPCHSAGTSASNLHVLTSFPAIHQVLSLQNLFSDLEMSPDRQTLWIDATDETLDGAAARGFTRSLRREATNTDIRLVLFVSSWEASRRTAAMHYLTGFPYLEHELAVDVEGNLLVPRIVLQPSVDEKSTLDMTKCWKLQSPSLLVQSVPDILRDGEVAVQILSVSTSGTMSGVVGVVRSTRSSSWAAGARVVGVSSDSMLSNYTTFFQGQIAAVPDDVDVHMVSALAVPLLILALALGGHLTSPERLRGQRVLVPQHQPWSDVIEHLWPVFGLDPSVLKVGSFPESDSCASDIVIAQGATDRAKIQVLKSRLKAGAFLFVWDDLLSGVSPSLHKDRWLAGDILQKYLPVVFGANPDPSTIVAGREPYQLLPPTLTMSIPVLFDSDKFYLILGGIGSFGIHLAIWMYEKGARRIILTSRSGARSLNDSAKQSLKQALGYLERLPDVELRLEACDSTSPEQVSGIVNSLRQPLAGCVFLSAMLVDGLLMSFDSNRTQEYLGPIASKIDAFEVIEKAIPIGNLDFFISTGSVVSFGSAGQTNYSAANTALEWLTGRYQNAFTLVAPAITDSTFALSRYISQTRSPWAKYAMSCRDLCICIEDGLKKLRAGSFRTYVPDFDWDGVQGHLGPSPMYERFTMTATSNSSISDASDILEETVLRELHLDKAELDPTIPLTSYGLDSLSASRLSSALKPVLSITQLQLLADLTLQDLHECLKQNADIGSAPDEETSMASKSNAMHEMVTKYIQGFPSHRGQRDFPLPSEKVVLVTGTTGELGCYLLSRLLADSNVVRVYALNRSSPQESLRERQALALLDRGLPAEILNSPKLSLLEGDIAKLDFDLTARVYQQMQQSVTHIIHTAWPVDFTLGLPSFEPNIKGLRKIVDFSLASPFLEPPRLLFTSSVGVFRNIDRKEPLVETSVDSGTAAERGYPESKWVAEQILAEAAQSTPSKPLVVRVGQLCGGINGAWNAHEWVPALVQSARVIGCIPADSRLPRRQEFYTSLIPAPLLGPPLEMSSLPSSAFRLCPTRTGCLDSRMPHKRKKVQSLSAQQTSCFSSDL